MKASLRFLAAFAIAFTVVNHVGIDLNAVRSGNWTQGDWIQSDRAEARRSGGRSRGGSFGTKPRSTTSTSTWSNDSGSGGTSHTTSTWSDGYGTGRSSTTSTHSNSSWSNGSSSGRSSQSSTSHRSSYSGRMPAGVSPPLPPAPVVNPVPRMNVELEMETEYAQSPAEYETGSDPVMRLMMLFLLLGGAIAAGLLVYLIYQQMAERSPVK